MDAAPTSRRISRSASALPTTKELQSGYMSNILTFDSDAFRHCLRDPIADITKAARYLDQAVSAHLNGQRDSAEELIRLADIPAIREWTESLWGKNSPYVRSRPSTELPLLAKHERVRVRMPSAIEKHNLHLRDGYHCRFCGIPVVRKEIRQRIRNMFPNTLRWGITNWECHAAFQAMWAQYDHLVPHARGGTNELANVVVTCAPCNFGRMDHCLEEVGLLNPLAREPVRSGWDGLERFH